MSYKNNPLLTKNRQIRTLTISVIIPACGCEKTLPETLTSIQLSSFQPLEIIIVNDGASDKIASIADDFQAKNINIVPRRGPAHARNDGARRAKGNILLFLDADALIPSDWLSIAVKTLDENSQLAGLSSDTSSKPLNEGFFAQFSALQEAFYVDECRKKLEGSSMPSPLLTTRCCVIRKEIFWDIGGFESSIKCASVEDFEFSERLLKQHTLRTVRSVQIHHHWPATARDILKNYFHRCVLWVVWVHSKNFGFGHVVTTSRQAMATLTGGLSIIFWIVTILYPPAIIVAFFFTLLHIIANRNYYRFITQRTSPWFTVRASLFLYITTLPIILGYFCGLTILLIHKFR